MTKEKKKYSTGAAKVYISRAQALKKLQLSLKHFRRLCILKGIHPHEPRHKTRVNKGGTDRKTWYFTKDIHYLAHEPLLRKFREQTVFFRKLKRAKSLRENNIVDKLRNNEPQFKYDHIVRERYPTLVDAIRDQDDGLCLLFLFARLPCDDTKIPARAIRTCRRLTQEFLHYVIAAKALKYVFVSIKGIYYQADILGETVTWIVPHERPYQQVEDVDFKLMAIFVDFYMTMTSFINYRLYTHIKLVYPPKLAMPTNSEDFEADKERIYSLTRPLMSNSNEKAIELDQADVDRFEEDEDPLMRAAQIKQRLELKLASLFKGLRFFVSRETPCVQYLFSSCGGEVSCENVYGQTYDVADARITHHVINVVPTFIVWFQVTDRPHVSMNMSRVYVQPQWVYDSVNARMLLPPRAYLPGPNTQLPPHLSPFVSEQPGDYVPSDKLNLLRKQGLELEAAQLQSAMHDDEKRVQEEKKTKAKKQHTSPVVADVVNVQRKSKVANRVQKELNAIGEQRKLQESMIAKKHRRVYQKLVGGQKKKRRQVRTLIEKRQSLNAT